jgi:hypothetical protein
MTKEFKSRLQQQKRGVGGASSPQKPTPKAAHPDLIQLVMVLHEGEYRRSVVDHMEIEKLMHIYDQLILMGKSTISLPEISPDEYLSLQLWWERQLEGVAFDKRHSIVAGVVQKTLHELIRQVLKDHTLSSDQKQSLVQMMR